MNERRKEGRKERAKQLPWGLLFFTAFLCFSFFSFLFLFLLLLLLLLMLLLLLFMTADWGNNTIGTKDNSVLFVYEWPFLLLLLLVVLLCVCVWSSH